MKNYLNKLLSYVDFAKHSTNLTLGSLALVVIAFSVFISNFLETKKVVPGLSPELENLTNYLLLICLIICVVLYTVGITYHFATCEKDANKKKKVRTHILVAPLYVVILYVLFPTVYNRLV